MATTQLDGLLARMPEIAEAVERFKSDAIQARVLDALLDAFGVASGGGGDRHPTPADMSAGGSGSSDVTGKSDGAKKTVAKKAASKGLKGKQVFTIDKDLDLARGAAQSFKDFAESKKPTTAVEKALVAVYWLTRVREDGPATVDQVYTCFKGAAWAIPSDLVNTIQQAGTKGWLDSKKRDDLKVVVGGENYVEHSMPASEE